MSVGELLVIIFALLVGYGVAAQLMTLTRDSRPAGSNGATRGDPQGEPTGGRIEDIDVPSIQANWHEVLGVSRDASLNTIKSAYRLKAHQYHPDKTEGLGPELRALAAHKMRELNTAYAWATRSQREH